MYYVTIRQVWGSVAGFLASHSGDAFLPNGIIRIKLTWILRAFWMVLAYERLEERCIDDVTNNKFCFLINKSNRFHIAVGLFRNRSQMTSNVVRISVTPGCTSCATIMFLFVNKIRGMVSFKPGKDIKKDVFSSCHERGTKKKFWVPTKNRTSDLRIPGSDALPLSHRDSTVSEVYYEVHMTRFLHTARISSLIPHEGSEFFLCSTLVTGRKTSFSISLQGSKLTISVILYTNITLSTLLILAVYNMLVIITL